LILQDKPKFKWVFPLCCLPMIQPGPWFHLVNKQLVLQYVIIRPTCSIAGVIMEIIGVYGIGEFSPKKGYFYIAIIQNISVIISVYCLILFYVAAKEELDKREAIHKFLCIKFVIFFCFWQSIFIAVLAYVGVIRRVGGWTQLEVTTGLQEMLIVIEMYIVAIIHMFVFKYQEYRDRTQKSKGVKIIKNFGKVVNQKDVGKDVTSTFSPNKMAKTKVEDVKFKMKKKKEKENEKENNEVKFDEKKENDVELEVNDDKK